MGRYKGSMRSGGAVTWFFQRLTGLVLVLGLLWHFLVMHYLGSGHGVTFASVAARLTSPVWKAGELIFLLFAVFHGYNGLLNIIRDFSMKPWVRGVLFSAVVLLGLTLLVLGGLTIATFKA